MSKGKKSSDTPSGDDEKTKEPKDERPEPEKLRDWLDVNGYPLEMRTARAFHVTGEFDIDQSSYYLDATGTPHEVDVIATRHTPVKHSAKDSVYAVVRVIVECKSNARSEKPWVVLTTEKSEYDVALTADHYAASEVARNAIEEIRDNAQPSELLPLTMPDRAGYGIACANLHQKRDNNDLAYRAVTKLAQACRAHVAGPRDPKFVLIVPVLAVSTNLYEVTLGSDHEPIIRQQQHLPLIWRRPTDGSRDEFPLLVHVVHIDWMERFARQIVAMFDHVTTTFAETIATASVVHRKQLTKPLNP